MGKCLLTGLGGYLVFSGLSRLGSEMGMKLLEFAGVHSNLQLLAQAGPRANEPAQLDIPLE